MTGTVPPDAPDDEPARPVTGGGQGIADAEAKGHIFQIRGRDISIRTGDVEAGRPRRRSGVRSRPAVLMAAGAVGVATVLVTGGFVYRFSAWSGNPRGGPGASARSSSARAAGPAVTDPVVSVSVEANPLKLGSVELTELYGRDQDWLIPHPTVVVGRPPETGERAAEGFYEFVKKRGGVPVDRLFFNVTLQNLTGGAVYLRSMRVTGLRYGAPIKGTRVWSGGGADPLTPKAMLIDLDSPGPAPLLFSRIDEGWIAPVQDRPKADTSKARSFGFTLPGAKTESFDVVAVETRHRSCEFTLTIDAVLNGQSRPIRVDDHGEPFRVTGDTDPNMWQLNYGGNPNFVWTGGPHTGSAAGPAARGATQPLPETDP